MPRDILANAGPIPQELKGSLRCLLELIEEVGFEYLDASHVTQVEGNIWTLAVSNSVQTLRIFGLPYYETSAFIVVHLALLAGKNHETTIPRSEIATTKKRVREHV